MVGSVGMDLKGGNCGLFFSFPREAEEENIKHQ
jgi:hypothetical protein